MNDVANDTAPAPAPDAPPTTKPGAARKRAKRKARRRLAKVLIYGGVLLMALLAIAEPWLLLPIGLIVAGLILA
jgi:fatty acid desaturase